MPKKLKVGFAEETWGYVTVGADGSLEYSGNNIEPMEEYVERYARITKKTGDDLLTYIDDLPNSYLWTEMM